jgi:hypothetical protein
MSAYPYETRVWKSKIIDVPSTGSVVVPHTLGVDVDTFEVAILTTPGASAILVSVTADEAEFTVTCAQGCQASIVARADVAV